MNPSNLTPYARRFGLASVQVAIDPNKSGLTPVSPLLQNRQDPQSQQDAEARQRIINYQEFRLQGLTTRKLQEVDAITTRELKPNDLNCPIHPLLERERWVRDDQMTEKYHQMPRQISGSSDLWVASNDRVWEALTPCLKLASIVLFNIFRHPWFDTFLCGTLKDVDPKRLKLDDQLTFSGRINGVLQTLEQRPPHPTNYSTCQARFQEIVKFLTERLIFDFFSFKNIPASEESVTANGLTFSFPDGHLDLYLAHEAVAPLLQDDLPTSDRLRHQLNIAITFCHELVHAIEETRYAWNDFENLPESIVLKIYDPWFMDENSAELGYSIENALFGGKIVAWPLYSENELLSRDSQPILALCIGSWPDDHDHATPTLVEPALGQPETVIPLPVSYFEALQREDYWAAGFSSPGMLRPPPPNTGVAKINGEWRELEQLEHRYMEQTGSGKQIADMIKLSPNERLVYLGQHMREEQTKRLWKILEERNKVTARVEFQEEFCARQTSTDLCGQYSLLVGALENLFVPHEEGILLLLSLEQSGQTLTDTRNAHVSFTRNFRKCVRRTLEILRTNKLDDLVQRLDKLEIQLENVRLQVHDPVEAISKGQIGATTQEENYELNLLQEAVDTPDEDLCLRLCDTIIASLGSNLWVKSIARALKGTRCEKLPKMDRINNLHRAKETLKKITPPAQLAVERDQWVRRCEENIVIFQNDKEPKAQT